MLDSAYPDSGGDTQSDRQSDRQETPPPLPDVECVSEITADVSVDASVSGPAEPLVDTLSDYEWEDDEESIPEPPAGHDLIVVPDPTVVSNPVVPDSTVIPDSTVDAKDILDLLKPIEQAAETRNTASNQGKISLIFVRYRCVMYIRRLQ